MNEDEGEAILDAEWASAAAPSAAIQLASCNDQGTTFGGLIALQNLLAASSRLTVISISYGECELQNGEAANQTYYYVYQQAIAEGIAIFVSSGDSGAAVCDQDAYVPSAHTGITVNAFASTPYNVAVGGTDFSDTYSRTSSTYWNPSNSAIFGSALSYVPEIPWNSTRGSTLIAQASGYSTTYGDSGFCNSVSGVFYLNIVAGSGGPVTARLVKPRIHIREWVGLAPAGLCRIGKPECMVCPLTASATCRMFPSSPQAESGTITTSTATRAPVRRVPAETILHSGAERAEPHCSPNLGRHTSFDQPEHRIGLGKSRLCLLPAGVQ